MAAALLVGSCTATATPLPPATDTLVPPTATLRPSETPAPLPTETATVTPSPSPLPSRTPTPSSTATPAVAFDQLEVFSYSEETGSNLLILKVPGVRQDYNIKIDNFDYRCYYDAQYIDRLYCWGNNRPTFSRNINIVFYDLLTNELVHASKIMISVKPTLWPVVWNSSNNCDQRGENVACTVECRISPESGNPCLAASCYDACGYYFSVNSCPPDMSFPFESCSKSQRLEQFALYGIPLDTGDAP